MFEDHNEAFTKELEQKILILQNIEFTARELRERMELTYTGQTWNLSVGERLKASRYSFNCQQMLDHYFNALKSTFTPSQF